MAENPTVVQTLRELTDRYVRNSWEQMLLAPHTNSTATQTAQPPLTAESFNKMLADIPRLRAEFKRKQITIVVVAGRRGSMTIEKHPTDGTFVECNYTQATVIDHYHPLRFSRSRSVDVAEFVPIFIGFDCAYLRLFPPPYDPPLEGE